MSEPAGHAPARSHPNRDRIREWGSTSWQLVGILLAASMTYTLVVAFSGLVVPLLLSVVVATLCVPRVNWLEQHRMPRPAGALVLIAVLIAIGILTIMVIVRGVVDEAVEISAVMTDGVEQVDDWLPDGGVTDDPSGLVDDVGRQSRPLLAGAATWATTIFSSAVAFGIGAFLSLFMMYYILVDWVTVRAWLAKHLGVPADLGVVIATTPSPSFVGGSALWLPRVRSSRGSSELRCCCSDFHSS